VIRVLIVDDEPLARDGLRLLLAADPDVAAIDEARSGRDAIARIEAARPDLVLLDIQMPGIDGFGVIEQVGADRMPAVVFVTAHDRYAVQAFELSALDYLLKPVTGPRFARALARAKAQLDQRAAAGAGDQLRQLLETLASPTRHLRRIAVRTGDTTRFVDSDAIDWIAAAENYVELHVGAARHLVHVALGTLEKSLDPARFVRIHRSAIVQVDRICSARPAQHGEYILTLTGGATVRSGRSYHDAVKALLSNPFERSNKADGDPAGSGVKAPRGIPRSSPR
jgi:two-component system LytT family response regulator